MGHRAALATDVSAATESAPPRPLDVDRSRAQLLTLAVGLAVALVATSLRFRDVGLIPRFTDETDVAVRALAISRGELFPLTDTDGYVGAGFSYLLAGLFAALGPDPVLPRYLVGVLGLLTVGAAFLLGRELAAAWLDRPGATAAGVLAAALVAVSPVHVVVNSRIGWSHATTPLFTTLALWLLARAAARQHGPSLALSGLLFGIALQTHPTVAALLPGAAVWAFWRSGRPPRSRWLAVALVLGALGCSTLLAHNLLTGLGSIREALAKSDAYAAERAGAVGYVAALGLELQGLVRVLAGAIGERRNDLAPLAQPGPVAWALLAPIAIGVAARRGVWLPLFVSVPFLLALPILNAKYEPLLNGRYLMPIVPLVVTSVAMLAVVIWRWAGRDGPWLRAAIVAAVGLLLADPLLQLNRFERAALADGGNAPYFELAERIRRERRPDELVLLDAELGGARVASGRAGTSVVEYLLVVHPDPLPVQSGEPAELLRLLPAESGRSLLVLLPDARRAMGARHRLAPVGTAPSGREQQLRNVGLYRIE